MSKEIRITPAAEADLYEIASFFEGRVEGSGLQFILAVDKSKDQLSRFPQSGRIRPFRVAGFQEVRSWGVRRFPDCLVIYEDRSDCVNLIRILHGARDLEQMFSQ